MRLPMLTALLLILMGVSPASAQTTAPVGSVRSEDGTVVSVVLAQAVGNRGRVVVVLEEIPEHGDAVIRRDLVYHFLFVERGSGQVTTDHTMLAASRDGVGSGPDCYFAGAYFTPEMHLVYVYQDSSGGYLGEIAYPGMEGGRRSLLVGSEAPKTPLRATFTGGIDSRDLTIMLTDGKQQFRFLWDPDSDPDHPHWKRLPTTAPAAQK